MQAVGPSPASTVLRKIVWICAFSPSALLFALITFAVHVRIGLEHWPEPMWENYSTPLASAHELLLVGILYFTLFAAPVIWLVSASRRAAWTDYRVIKQFAVYAAGWGLLFAAGNLDPTTFTAWLLD